MKILSSTKTTIFASLLAIFISSITIGLHALMAMDNDPQEAKFLLFLGMFGAAAAGFVAGMVAAKFFPKNNLENP